MLFLVALTISGFGGGNGAIFLDEVDCNGQEERLEHCRHHGIGVENCEHSEDVGVICGSSGIFYMKQVCYGYNSMVHIIIVKVFCTQEFIILFRIQSLGGCVFVILQVILFDHTDQIYKGQCGLDELEPELQRKEFERYKNIHQQKLALFLSHSPHHLMPELAAAV